MELMDVHPFRWLSERPKLASKVKAGAAGIGSYDDCDLVDIQEGTIGLNLDEGLLPFVPHPGGMLDAEASAFLAGERTAYVATARFFENGRNVVAPTKGLVSALERTDLRDIALSDLQWPFDVFHMAFGDMLRIPLFGSNAIVDGITFDVRGVDSEQPEIQVVMTSVLSTRRAEKGRRIKAAHQVAPTFALTLTEGKTLAEMFDNEIELQVIGVMADSARDGRPEEAGLAAARIKDFRKDLRRLLTIGINVVAYMTSEPEDGARVWPADAALPKGVDRGSIQATPRGVVRRLEAEGFVPITVVGARVTEMLRASGGNGDELAYGHWRRGHWRRQRYGKGHALSRIQWIRPTIVRSDLEMDPRSHLYVNPPVVDGAAGEV